LFGVCNKDTRTMMLFEVMWHYGSLFTWNPSSYILIQVSNISRNSKKSAKTQSQSTFHQ
jgi:hypothetical protein